MKRISIVLILSIFVFAGCKKDDTSDPTNATPPSASYKNPQLSGTTVQANFMGKITTKDGIAVPNAIVKVGGKQFTTNSQGLYQITNATVDQDFAVITINKSGYYKQFRNLKPRVNAVNNVDISLILKTYDGGFASATGGVVNVPGGGSVTFAPNSLVDNTGNSYAGDVVVASTYLDPTDLLLPRYMPGSLQAVDEAGESTSMLTYGMIGLELYSSTGQSLQLAEGLTASVEFPIQAEQTSYAPTEIPLWFFDEQNGIWREEGSATRVGDSYQGEVKHFTFWNCDANFDVGYDLSGTIILNNETNSTGQLYLRVVRSDGSYSTGYTDQNGYFSGMVPGNEPLVFEVISSVCYNQGTLYSMDVAPLSQNTDLGDIVVESSEILPINFSGTIVDCDNNPLSDVAFIYQNSSSPWDGGYVISDGSGHFDFSFLCPFSGTVSYDLIDFNDALVGISGEVDYDTESSFDYPLGDLSFCDVVADETYFNYTEGGNSFYMPYVTLMDSLSDPGGCLSLIGQIQPNLYTEYASIDFGSVDAPGLAPTCSTEGGYITGTLPDGNIYQGYMSNYVVTITTVELDGEDYTILEGTYTADVGVTILDSGTTVNQYNTTASGNFRYQQ